MLEPSFAYTLTQLTVMKGFFQANQVEYNKKLDRVITAGFGYRRQRVKAMIHSFFGLDQRVLPLKTTGNAPLIAQRLNLSGIAISLGYDIANTRNNRVFINAGTGGVLEPRVGSRRLISWWMLHSEADLTTLDQLVNKRKESVRKLNRIRTFKRIPDRKRA